MEDNYMLKINQYQNQYYRYMAEAERVFRENHDQYSKDQCICLQRAAECQSEMANISIGAEKEHHQQELQRLNFQIKEIVKILNPSYGEKEKSSQANDQKNEKTSEPQKISPEKQGAEKWIKEAPRHSFADVSGMENLKKQLEGCIGDIQWDGLKQYLGMEELHSYFFIGPPGCGKTYIIEAFAHELMTKSYKYLSITGSDILSKYVGEAEKIVTSVFETAEKCAPSLLFIDEIDGVCKNRSLPNLPEYASSLTTAFLTAYNRINSSPKRSEIIFIGATNYPNRVDNAMLDRVELIRVPLPDVEAREKALERKLKKVVALEDGFSFAAMAEKTEGYNYRDLDRLILRIKDLVVEKVRTMYKSQEQAIEALKAGQFKVGSEIFAQAQKECLPTPKADILRELDEWEDRFKKREE